MAKYVRTSKRLQRIRWPNSMIISDRALKQHEEMLCCFLPAFQESTSLEELHIHVRGWGRSSSLALENMLTHTQSLRSLSLILPAGPLDDLAMAAASSGLEKNTTLRDITLEYLWHATNVSPILTSLRDHPHLRRLRLNGFVGDLIGLETLLLSDTSKITELDIHKSYGDPMTGLTRVWEALARRPTLTKLGVIRSSLGPSDAGELGMVLRFIPSLQSLDLTGNYLLSTGLVELAPALYRNTSIQVLDVSDNDLNDMESAELLRRILCRNKTITTLDLSGNSFGQTTGAVECIAVGLGRNSTLLKIDVSRCALGDDGFVALVSALEQNTTLLHLDLSNNTDFSERAFLALAERLPEIQVLQRIDLSWCEGLVSAMPLLLVGLRQNTSLFRFNVFCRWRAFLGPTNI